MMTHLIKLFLLLFALFVSGVFAQNNIAIFPFLTNGIDDVTAQSAEALLRLEISKLSTMDIVSEKRTYALFEQDYCFELTCAVELGTRLGAGRVVVGRLDALGEKVIVSYMLVDVKTQKSLLTDKTTSATIEDLETVMSRIAKSITTIEPIVKGAKVGAIMESETKEPYRRGARRFGGLSFGYLYPQNGYDNDDRAFAIEFRTCAEIQNFDVGMQIAMRRGFAMNIYSSCMFTKTDFCPYVGGGFGFHWVNQHHNYDEYYDSHGNYQYKEKKSDGFELTVNTGIKAFRTYNFFILANLAYTFTLNDYNDQAVIFSIGWMH